MTNNELIRETALYDIAQERQRQIEKESWSIEHDDEHTDGALAQAAAVYAYVSCLTHDQAIDIFAQDDILGYLWPWDPKWYKPETQRRCLIKAAALIVAEIERLDRKNTTG